MANGLEKKDEFQEEDITDMNDLSKLLDLNEEDELLLLQIEVEQEGRNIRREEKRRRKEEKKSKKQSKGTKASSNHDDDAFIRSCLDALIDSLVRLDEPQTHSKRTLEHSDLSNATEESSKRIKTEETS